MRFDCTHHTPQAALPAQPAQLVAPKAFKAFASVATFATWASLAGLAFAPFASFSAHAADTSAAALLQHWSTQAGAPGQAASPAISSTRCRRC